MLLRRKNSHEWLPLELDPASVRHSNAPLGVVPDTRFDQQQIPLASGDRLFLHTDGLTEAMNAAGGLFGKERLMPALAEAGGEALPVLKQSVLDAVARHTGGAAVQDDLTLLALAIR